MVKLIALIGLVSLSGCAPTVWLKDGATQESFAQDKAQCVYEAKRATAGYSNGRSGVAGGFAEGLEMGSRESELATLCMQGRGYRIERKPG